MARATRPDGAAQAGLLAGSGLGLAADWQAALDVALDGALAPLRGEPPDLLLLFASDRFTEDFPHLLRHAAERSGAGEIAGCGASGVIGRDREIEGEPAVAALALRLPPGSLVGVARVHQADIARLQQEGGWSAVVGLQPAACTGLVVMADPFTVDVQALVSGLARDYPGVPTVGGMASGVRDERRTFIFHGTHAEASGAVVVGLSGAVRLRAVVSQGCEPIGEPWTITDAEGQVIRTIGNRPTYEVLVETIAGLDEKDRRRVVRNLLVGLAMDEYRDAFRRGDFLIRNLVGADPRTGAIAVGARPRVGQTLQFQVRDARAADEELRCMLAEAARDLSGPPAATLLFACNGRGSGLFGKPHHDAHAARDLLGGPPLAGLFCNGEIGPVGGRIFLHGFTASMGLIVAGSGA